MAHSFTYDLLVIGSGPAGIHGAVQAAKLGKRVAIIEAHPEKIGGSWIHTGTLPSKTMREVLATVQSLKPHVGAAWVSRLTNEISPLQLSQRAQTVASEEEDLVRRHLKNNDIKLIKGFGRLEDAHHVRVLQESTADIISSEYILIATGSKPRRPVDIPFDDWRIVDSDSILSLQGRPQSLLVFGAGVIGCEYACIFGALGVPTTIVDARAQIMQTVDKEVAEALKRSMEELGIVFKLGQKLEKLTVHGTHVHAKLTQDEMNTDVFFYAAGRESRTQTLGLERLNIETDARGTIQVNQCFQTFVSNIYAAGDVIGPPALASTSTEQGRIAVGHMFEKTSREFPKIFPIGIYTIPELSSVGKSEEELNREGVDYVAGRATFDEIARGYIRGDHHGLLKILVCRNTQRLLGLHIVGPDAANLIHIGQVAMLKEMRVDEMVNSIIFNYPTLAEAYRIAAFNALNQIYGAQKNRETKEEDTTTPTFPKVTGAA